MIAGNAEFWLGIFIGFVMAALAFAAITISALAHDRDRNENQYDPERMP